MAYLTDWDYYENQGNDPQDENWGSYQYVPVTDIVNNFMLNYTGNTSLINNEPKYKVLWHAKRAIQELNYDSFNEIRILELEVCETLRFVLPQDYVNWVRVSLMKNGGLYPMTENVQTLHSGAYLQDDTCRILFDEDGYVLKPEFSNFDVDRLDGRQRDIYMGDRNSPYYGKAGYCIDGAWCFDYAIQRFGLQGDTANINPTFDIDRRLGVINFQSNMLGETVVLEYITDGMEAGDNSKIVLNKMFEDYVYAYIEYCLLDSKLGVQEYIVRRKKNKAYALLSNAEIRIGNIHPSRIIQSIRGGDNWIK